MSIDNKNKENYQILQKSKEYCLSQLEGDINPPSIIIKSNDYCKQHKSFGGYLPSTNQIYIVVAKRNLADVCRTLNHEIYHSYQNNKGQLNQESGKDGDNVENEANAFAGKTMREFGRNNPDIYFKFFE